ncbi:Mog1p/PsbP-like protein [Eremomyces bilateralis CBS 781.70]|uniref:Mog1p/PsbP-like protein n=1 Tax=Eremomyces bilateralis CBS 781.70 TaxID=1392243 RepID=A0A6G1FRV7_9PEZI|nr:Mog1p/PsbP-like protein [Eremomyces bilateralis CBS 781.70]KAF1808466.1 Mog1p/PsbP-like protein [Eremomyces bilateralis CBS 781.70]
MSSNQIKLYGGAIEVDLPERFKDVSSIREVPDSQEVYLDKDGFASVIFDILEHIGPSEAKDDLEALDFHFRGITDDTGDETMVHKVSSTEPKLDKMPNTKVLSLLGSLRSKEGARPRRANEADWTAILLALVRLPEKGTDIVITVNVPHVPSFHPENIDIGNEQFDEFVKDGLDVMEQVMATFDVKDWNLFVND